MFCTSVIEISKSALQQNFSFIREMLGTETVFSSVVKGNAYGHGIEEFVPLALECGQRHFCVFSSEEARRVREITGDEATTVIMGMISPDELEWAVQNNVEFYVFDMARLEGAVRASGKTGQKAVIHIEMETGMNRTGFSEKDLPQVIEFLKKHNEKLTFRGLCTHYAGAESIANYFRVTHQIKTFRKLKNRFRKKQLEPEICHTACSAAAIRFPSTRMDLARIGIMQYGYWPNTETYISHLTRGMKDNPLKRIITWKSRIMSIKEVKTGEFIGYGTAYLASKNMRIAIVPVGYSHGFSRSLSNQGRVLCHGERTSVLGSVSMNSFTMDITDIPAARVGDEVVIIGNQGDLSLSVASFSEMSNQLNYELLTRLPENIPRKIIE
ncbi:MAG: alanine racemase [Deltaproteobacteria bacterium]|nr:alanine racemase [Deltaproteobacteria bacterium]